MQNSTDIKQEASGAEALRHNRFIIYGGGRDSGRTYFNKLVQEYGNRQKSWALFEAFDEERHTSDLPPNQPFIVRHNQ